MGLCAVQGHFRLLERPVKQIPLSQGLVAIVDDDCPDEVVLHKWCVAFDRWGKCYAVRTSIGSDGSRKTERMHRLIAGADPGVQVDHIDGNGLNNQRCNLRICLGAENARNRKLSKNSASGLKGVGWHKRSKKWQARIAVGGRRVCLGLFASLSEAAEAYDRAAVEMHGEFAQTNKSLGLTDPDRKNQ